MIEKLGKEYPETLTAEETVAILNDRFKNYFPDHAVEARISDGILADAAAGGDVVKIREGRCFPRATSTFSKCTRVGCMPVRL